MAKAAVVFSGHTEKMPSFGTIQKIQIGPSARPAFVVENAIEPVARKATYQYFKNLSYSLSGVGRIDTEHVRHLVHSFSKSEVRTHPILRRFNNFALNFLKQAGFRTSGLNRCYVNMNLFGDYPFAHTDGDEWTFLFFVNERWHQDWGGEIALYDESVDFSVGIPPRPSRMLLFDGRINHRGGAPSKHCQEPRVVVVLRFEKK